MALVGKILAGKYRVLRVLGQGGCGSVFLVEIVAGMVGEKLALKILPEELGREEQFRGRFINEIRTAMRLVERHIIQIRDVGVSEEGLLYYTMDYSPGVTLAEVLQKEGKLGIERSIQLAVRVLYGLQAAHAQGVIHRDLKPANLMVENQGGKETVRILDFGIATAIQARSGGGGLEEKKTAMGGSLHYMPPEQFLGERLGFYTDLYAVGTILYECLTGQRPYHGKTFQEVFDDMKSRPAINPVEFAPELKEHTGLVKVVLKALERNPDNRYQSAREFASELVTCLKTRGQLEEVRGGEGAESGNSGAVAARPGPTPPAAVEPLKRPVAPKRARSRTAQFHRRHPVGGLALVIGALAFSGLVIGYFIFGQELKKFLGFEPRDGQQGSQPAGSGSSARPGDKKASSVDSRSSQALKEVKKIDQPPPIDPRQQAREEALKKFAEARQAQQDGDWKKVHELCLKSIPPDPILAQEPVFAQAYRLKGLAEVRLEKWDEAADSLTAALALLPIDEVGSELLLGLADALLNSKAPDAEGAKRYLGKVLELEPANRDAFVKLLKIADAESSQAEGQEAALEEMTKLIEQARARKIDDPLVAQLARKYLEDLPRQREQSRQKLKDEILEAYKAQNYTDLLKKGEPVYEEDNDLELGLMLAEAYRETGRYQDGVRLLFGVAQRVPAEPASYLRVAMQFGQSFLAAYENSPEKNKADLDNALANFKSVMALLDEGRGDDPRAKKKLKVKASVLRARVYAYLVNWEEQRKDLKFIESEADRKQEADFFLHSGKSGYLLAERVSEKSKQEAYQRAIALLNIYNENAFPRNPEAHFLIGLSYLGQGKNDSDFKYANNNFSQALKAGMKTPELYKFWGKALDNWGRFDEAGEKYRESYELSPNEEVCALSVINFMSAFSDKKDPKHKKSAQEILTRGLNQLPNPKRLKDLQIKYGL
ncbi:MAG: protein kinase [Planctomycetes bacterium]|nr:protein kinase [Planctomycetota bacterium]